MPDLATPLATQLQRYAARWPKETDVLRGLAWLQASPTPFHRESAEGHFTGSAWVVSADGERALLMLHRKLGRWLQPGGHADGDPDLAAVALREAEEETGLTGLVIMPDIFDVDVHRIPARGSEPEHWHYDVRYALTAAGSEAFVVNEESLELAWRSVGELATAPDTDPSLRRMAMKWLAGRGVGG